MKTKREFGRPEETGFFLNMKRFFFDGSIPFLQQVVDALLNRYSFSIEKNSFCSKKNPCSGNNSFSDNNSYSESNCFLNGESCQEKTAAEKSGVKKLNFGNAILAFPGSNSCRIFEELLARTVEERQKSGILEKNWVPPKSMTLGTFPEMLYPLNVPLANELTQELVWNAVLKEQTNENKDFLRPLTPNIGALEQEKERRAFCQTIARMYRELASANWGFEDVAKECRRRHLPEEAKRWEVLQQLSDQYLRRLDQLGLWDVQAARRFAIEHHECQTVQDVFLIGISDLNVLQKRILDQVSEYVHLFIFAPEEYADRFDEYGCVLPDVWLNQSIEISEEQMEQADSPEDQASAVLNWLKSFPQRFNRSDVILGVGDEETVPFLRQQLEQEGLRATAAAGTPFSENRVFLLLKKTNLLLKNRRFRDFADLLRHPDIDFYLRRQLKKFCADIQKQFQQKQSEQKSAKQNRAEQESTEQNPADVSALKNADKINSVLSFLTNLSDLSKIPEKRNDNVDFLTADANVFPDAVSFDSLFGDSTFGDSLDWISEIDRFQNLFLPTSINGFWFGSLTGEKMESDSAEQSIPIKNLFELVCFLLKPLFGILEAELNHSDSSLNINHSNFNYNFASCFDSSRDNCDSDSNFNDSVSGSVLKNSNFDSDNSAESLISEQSENFDVKISAPISRHFGSSFSAQKTFFESVNLDISQSSKNNLENNSEKELSLPETVGKILQDSFNFAGKDQKKMSFQTHLSRITAFVNRLYESNFSEETAPMFSASENSKKFVSKLDFEVQEQIGRSLNLLSDVLGEIYFVPESLIPDLTITDLLDILLERLSKLRLPEYSDAASISLYSWLSLPFIPSSTLVLTGFNEGKIPESFSSDLFLPNSIREALALDNNRKRFARDIYYLSSLLRTKNEVHLIFGRHSLEGEPLIPSRLLFMTNPENLARRICRFFSKPQTKPSRKSTDQQIDPTILPSNDHLLLTSAVLTQKNSPMDQNSTGQNGLQQYSDGQNYLGQISKRRIAVSRPSLFEPPILQMTGPCPTVMNVTEFRDFLACPYRYFLRHSLRLQTLNDERQELDAAAFGNLAHEVLKQFGLDKSVCEETNADIISGWLNRELDTIILRMFGKNPVSVVQIQAEQLRRRLVGFARWQANWRQQGNRIRFVEIVPEEADALSGEKNDNPKRNTRVHWRGKTSVSLKVDGLPMYLRGRIDRIDYHPESNQWFVFDYKTADTYFEGISPDVFGRRIGNTPDKKHRKNGQWIDLQLPLYRHFFRQIIKRLLPETEANTIIEPQLGFINLPKDVEKSGGQLAPWSLDDLDLADEVAKNVVRAVRFLWERPIDPQMEGIMSPKAPAFTEMFAPICLDDIFHSAE